MGNYPRSSAGPGNPPNETWGHVIGIVSHIVGNAIGVTCLIGRSLTCAAAGVAIVGADISDGDGQPLI
jgi:hypothetical protein